MVKPLMNTLFDDTPTQLAGLASESCPRDWTMTLGLDLGPSSIGWALVRENEATGQAQLVDMGVRVFPEGKDNYGTTKEKSKNEDRRVARSQRRRIMRRKRRKMKLKEALTRLGLLDLNSDEWKACLHISPYRLRAEALSRKLTPTELSRVLLHLCQRRGFLSNRKTDRSLANDAESKGMLGELNALRETLRKTGQTLGQYLAAREAQPGQRPDPEQHRVRNRQGSHTFHATRELIFDEFDRIWRYQAAFYPDLLTDLTRWGTTGPRPALRPHKPRAVKKGIDWLTAFGIEGILFFQRPMYWPAKMVGRCELEPKQYRCPRADRLFQRFRILADVNHLRYRHPRTGDPVPLTAEQRAAVIALLSRKDRATFDQIRKAAHLDDNCKFTIEKGKKTTLRGHETDHALRSAAKSVRLDYDRLDETIKDNLVRLIADPTIDDFELRKRLCDDFSMTAEQAAAVAMANLPEGYAQFSLQAISRLLPHLEAGKIVMGRSAEDSAMHAAGYLRRDERKLNLLAELPRLEQIYTGALASINNPVVRAALYELRKVFNLLVKTYGRPDRVRVEYARELPMTRDKRREYEARLKEREDQRNHAREEIVKLGVKPTRDAIDRYLLWEEQERTCIYSGQPIGLHQLFGGEVDVDHILPESQSRDDSFMNKVVCFAACNREKGQQTVYQWLAAKDPVRYEAVLQRARNLPLAKRNRLKTEKVEIHDFVAQQLVDTSYFSRLAAEYLGLVVGRSNVQGSKGKYTSDLRWVWGLDTVLAELPDSPAWQEAQAEADKVSQRATLAREEGREQEAEQLEEQARKLREGDLGEKNRADHRHHAIDALVVALTTPSRIQALTRYYAHRDDPTVPPVAFDDPWPNFRRSVQDRIARVLVSHRVRRKVSGPLHEETHYGPVPPPQAGDPDLAAGGPAFAVRKQVKDLTDNEIALIRDRRIRELIQQQLGITGGRARRGTDDNPRLTGDAAARRKAVLENLKWPNGLPIRRVRINKPDQTIRPIRESTQLTYVKPGNTHHLAIFEDDSGARPKRYVQFVTMLEAAQRLARHEPVIQRQHPNYPKAKFVMSLSNGEMVLMDLAPGRQVVAVLKTSVATEDKFDFALHSDARPSNTRHKIRKTVNTLKARKVLIDPIGRLRWAND